MSDVFPRLLRFTSLPALCGLLAAWLSPVARAEKDESLIEIKAMAGLRYDVPRFRVAPGARVRIVLENADDMAHNLVITAPGARMEIVMTAMAMPITPEQTFVPASDKVLWSIPVLTPGRKGELSFTAPKKEGVYPYVCSYPGHGVIMFGAMYVSKKASLPPLEQDPNVPETAKELAGAALHAFDPKPPYLYRTFLRDSGPASIAVALPGGVNYCWDAGACRLRYVWSGAFVDPLPHWRGNGDAFAEVKGRIWWRAGGEFPLRLGAKEKIPEVRFRGYRLVERAPEFRYELDGVEVRERIEPLPGGGIADTFTIAGKADVYYVAGREGGAALTSSGGTFRDGTLALTAAQARQFTVTLTDLPGKEPLGYWSMNDTLTDKKPLPVPGVIGRALVFDGKKSQFATGVKTEALKNGATFAVWVKLSKPDAKEQVFLGAQAGDARFAIGSNSGGEGLGVAEGNGAKLEQWHTGQRGDSEWHHVAVTLSPEATIFHLDGQKAGSCGALVLPPGAEFFLGSLGGKSFAAATLDEARIYDRVLADREIQQLAAPSAP